MRHRGHLLASEDHVDLESRRIGEPDHLAATRLIAVLDPTAHLGGQLLQVGQSLCFEAEADGCGVRTALRHVHVVAGAGGTGIQGIRGARGAHQAEVREERLLQIQIRDLVTDVGDITYGNHRSAPSWAMAFVTGQRAAQRTPSAAMESGVNLASA